VEILSIFGMSSPPAQTKSPPIEDFLATLGITAVKSSTCKIVAFYP